MATKRSLGYIGLGMMGGSMATHLLKQGYPVTVYDPNPAAVDAVLEFGGERAASPSAATPGWRAAPRRNRAGCN